ncbi:MAG: hypothetical protein SO016_07105 [Lachnospiraceae bacterium]|nr:hypothetical protein [Robinsoniella sp.]MDY3766445.1 hypothetical protein [Lachnospiraceae bacterium]
MISDEKKLIKRELQVLYQDLFKNQDRSMEKMNRFFELVIKIAQPAVARQMGKSEDCYAVQDIVSLGYGVLLEQGIMNGKLNYDEERGYFADYVVGIMNKLVLRLWRNEDRKRRYESSLSGDQTQEGGFSLEDTLSAEAYGSIREPESELEYRQTRLLQEKAVRSFLDSVIQSKEPPHQLLAMCYVKLMATFLDFSFQYNPYQWAENIMRGKTLRILADEFLKTSNKKLETNYERWGEAFENAMKGAYHKYGRDFPVLEEVVFTDHFNRKDLENYGERSCKKLVSQWMEKVGHDEELVELLIQYTQTREMEKEKKSRRRER